jgi:hypothetical protein
MATYGISGVWKSTSGTIIAYAFHRKSESTGIYANGIRRTKLEAVRILEQAGNVSDTLVWDYRDAGWYIGESRSCER